MVIPASKGYLQAVVVGNVGVIDDGYVPAGTRSTSSEGLNCPPGRRWDLGAQAAGVALMEAAQGAVNGPGCLFRVCIRCTIVVRGRVTHWHQVAALLGKSASCR